MSQYFDAGSEAAADSLYRGIMVISIVGFSLLIFFSVEKESLLLVL